MAKIYGYTGLMIGLMVLLNMAGIGGTSALAQFFSGWGLSVLVGLIAAMLVAWGIVGGISAGLFGRTVPESIVIAPIAGLLLTYSIADMFLVYQQMTNTCGVGSICAPFANVIFLLMSIFTGTYAIALIQWWRGNDIT
jgi:hypothetical protein